MPLLDWSLEFDLTSGIWAGSTTLPFNTDTTGTFGFSGYYMLNEQGCALRNTVRSTKEFIPQADGAILHRRFVGGMEMDLAIQLWETPSQPACNDLGQLMLDELMGYLINLLNAGDNQGRISWTPDGQQARMLDDLRLLSYPAESHNTGIMEVTVTLDTVYPYAADLNQLSAGIPDVISVDGNRPTYPVWQITGSSWTLTNDDTGQQIQFDDSLPGCPDVGGGYVEIDTLRNTAFLNGSGANMSPGIVMENSDFFMLSPGDNSISGASGTYLVNSAWA